MDLAEQVKVFSCYILVFINEIIAWKWNLELTKMHFLNGTDQYQGSTPMVYKANTLAINLDICFKN